MGASEVESGGKTAQAELFAQPLFEDPKLKAPNLKALHRVGVIDVGSNSVRMVVFDGAARSPAYFYNEKILCGLGAGLSETGTLNPEGRARALSALRRFALLARGMGIGPMSAVATAAVREAADGEAFCAEVARETGLKLWVIDGREEARFSAQGVLLGWPEAKGVICDIGGASMELAEVGDGAVGRRVTSPLGPFKLADVPGGRKGLKAHIAAELARLRGEISGDYKRLYLVGGSWRVIARLDMERRNYPLKVLHEYQMVPKQLLSTLKWIGKQDLRALRARTGTSAERMRLVPIAAEVLRQLIRTFAPKQVAVSSYGIREGLLYEKMPESLRHRDPLIEAARYSERSSARLPGFGRVLFEFLQPLYRQCSPERLRLVKAACLMHDVTWRAHPDYRAEVCFDNVTRANLSGLDHKGRVFLGLALLHRYKNNRGSSRFAPLYELLSDAEIRDAEVLGKAMRFGAMFSAQTPDMMGKLRNFPRKKVIELIIGAVSKDLYGEVAAARFASLAAALGATPRVTVARMPPARGAAALSGARR